MKLPFGRQKKKKLDSKKNLRGQPPDPPKPMYAYKDTINKFLTL